MKPNRAQEVPPVRMLAGLCQRWSPGGVRFSDECHFCKGSGQISYPAVWSAADDARLMELVVESRNPNHVALVLHRTQGTSRERESLRARAEPADWSEAKFCPVCGVRYPSGTPYCSKDATPLKEMP